MASKVQTECPLTIEWFNRPVAQQPRVIQSYELDSAYLTSTDAWSITLYDSDRTRLKNLQLEPLQLSIHGQPQLVGRIENIKRGGGGEITVSGRDHISVLVEGNVDPVVKVTEDMTLKQVILLAAGPYGIINVLGEGDFLLRNLRSGAPLSAGKDQGFPDLQPGKLKPEAGIGLYDWLNRLCARHGCTIQPGPDFGSVLLSAPNYAQSPIINLTRSVDPRSSVVNNIDRGQSNEDYSSFPTHGLAIGKIATVGESAKSAAIDFDPLKGLSDSLKALLEGKILSERSLPTSPKSLGTKLYRFLYVKDDEARTSAQVDRAIKRAVAERLRETLDYSVTVRDHKDKESGHIFAVDTIATVNDEVCEISEPMWVASRKFTYQQGQGAVTELNLWRPGSFVL